MSAPDRPRPRMGVFDKPYWEFAQRCELRLQRCTACGHVRYPPGPVCPQCLSDACEWCALSGRGRVVTWTVFHRQYLPEFPVPFAVISVATDEGPLLIGNLLNAKGTRVRIGLPVRAIFEQVGSQDGSWRICQWEPDGSITSEARTPTQSGEAE
jgi:uncharacterized protein